MSQGKAADVTAVGHAAHLTLVEEIVEEIATRADQVTGGGATRDVKETDLAHLSRERRRLRRNWMQRWKITGVKTIIREQRLHLLLHLLRPLPMRTLT